jgi:hypothetical protein
LRSRPHLRPGPQVGAQHQQLIKAVSDELRPALALRKQAAGVSAEDAAAYVDGSYELTPADVREIRKQVAHWRRVYEARYRDIRHGVFAHKGLDQAGADALMAKTNVEEPQPFGFDALAPPDWLPST